MSPSRRIAGFFVRLFVIYGLLAIPWPGLRLGYASLYCDVGNLIFGSFMPGGSVHFHPMIPPTVKNDTNIECANLETGALVTLITGSRNSAYLPTAFLVSLVLATPVPWQRRAWALLWGLMLMTVFVASCQLVCVLYAFNRPCLSLISVGPRWSQALETLFEAAQGDAVTWLAVAALIWVLVTFRRSDWETISLAASTQRRRQGDATSRTQPE